MHSFFLTLVSLVSFIFLTSVAHAQMVDKKLIGKGELHYLMLHVYDAELYSSDGTFSFDKPFALKLEYKRKLYGKKIADRSQSEIENLGFSDDIKLAAWHKQMKEIFPDVDKGVSITGVYTPNSKTVFYKNDQEIGVIQDPEFGKWFFGIWLDEKTSVPELRHSLLGNSNDI